MLCVNCTVKSLVYHMGPRVPSCVPGLTWFKKEDTALREQLVRYVCAFALALKVRDEELTFDAVKFNCDCNVQMLLDRMQ